MTTIKDTIRRDVRRSFKSGVISVLTGAAPHRRIGPKRSYASSALTGSAPSRSYKVVGRAWGRAEDTLRISVKRALESGQSRTNSKVRGSARRRKTEH